MEHKPRPQKCNRPKRTRRPASEARPITVRRRLPAGIQFAKAVARTALWGPDGNTPTPWASAVEMTCALLPWLNAYSRCHRGVALNPGHLRKLARTTQRKLEQHRTGQGLSPVRTAYWMAARELLSSGVPRSEEAAAWLVREMWERALAPGEPVPPLAGESAFLGGDEGALEDLLSLPPEQSDGEPVGAAAETAAYEEAVG